MQAGFASRPHDRNNRRLILHLTALERLTRDGRAELEQRLGRRVADEAFALALGRPRETWGRSA